MSLSEKTGDDAVAQLLIQAMVNGEVCLHPTDSLPGLGANLRVKGSLEKLRNVKGKPDSCPFIGLVTGLDIAFANWAETTADVRSSIEKIWPSAVTIIAPVKEGVAASKISMAGSLALRWNSSYVPWLRAAIDFIECPFPSTSVNIHGQPPATSWAEAIKVVELMNGGIHVPKFADDSVKPKPSTIIQWSSAEGWRLVREGAVPTERLREMIGEKL